MFRKRGDKPSCTAPDVKAKLCVAKPKSASEAWSAQRGDKSGQVWGDSKKISLGFLAQPSWKNKKAQVWVETVVYTLIALTIIGLFISFAKPKIEEIQDKAIIDQSIEMLEDINSIILSIVQGGVGNQRIIEVGIKKGTLEIDGINNSIVFEIDGRYTYTEPGPNGEPGDFINIRNILASTQKRGKISTVTLISNYSNTYDITYQGGNDKKLLGRSPVAHKISISNIGEVGGKPIINFELK